ncbi:MAG: DUF4388 domain-containing protein [Deltaproteobacteria bacterium]|nr:DUF4388 domain-containing protein [Deltaproteobacteria bacterium]MBI3294826.1 DUF4388 domain-containing protein [Deltaproteobacteria bacterium]
MASSRNRVIVLGETTQWGKQFTAALQATQAFDFVFEALPEKFLESTQVGHPQIVLIENLPGSRNVITKVRSGPRRVFLIWMGRSFTKEDLTFALENRVYGVFEDPKPEDPRMMKGLKGAAGNVEGAIQSEQILRSLKVVLLQHESDTDKPFLTEIKTAIQKLERSSLQNEFASTQVVPVQKTEVAVPFHESQAFSDALVTVHELERTGVLRVRGGAQQEGTVEFLQGKLISANTGAVKGIKALYRMFLWDDTHFVFARRDVRSDSIQTDLNGELQEICDRGDELRERFQKIRKEIPPPSLVVAMEPKWMQISTTMTPHFFSTLSSVIEFGQVSLVMDYNPLSDVDVMENLIALKLCRAIKVVATRAPLAL